MKSLTEFAHMILKMHINPNDVIIDATCGNGLDTLFCCQNVRFVYGFDIQDEAITKTKSRLAGFNNYKLILDSFENFDQYVKHFDGIVFNLGYLPNSTTTNMITTTSDITIKTLDKLLNLNHNFYLLMMVYPGHNEGYVEALAINDYLNTNKIKYLKVSLENTKNLAPYIIFIDYKAN